MKQFFAILVMAMLVATVSVSEVSAQAEMKFEKTTVDYGTIEQGSDPFRVFSFTNTGSEPLIIKSAKGSCGCTVPTYPKQPIAPGETGEIKVRYDTKRIGVINKSVTLQTNAGVKILKIKGKVNKPSEGGAPASKPKSILDQ